MRLYKIALLYSVAPPNRQPTGFNSLNNRWTLQLNGNVKYWTAAALKQLRRLYERGLIE